MKSNETDYAETASITIPQKILYTDIPAYSDTGYSDNLDTVTLLSDPHIPEKCHSMHIFGYSDTLARSGGCHYRRGHL